MSRIIIEIKDNPQEIDIETLIQGIRTKMLDLGLFVAVTIEKND